MSDLFVVGRTPRSSRSELAKYELHQDAVIAALLASGDRGIAQRLQRCRYDRQHRQSRWPWRCHSPGCWACRRTMVRRWWRGIARWLADADTSLAVIPTIGDPLTATRRLRRSLRDVRDRAARCDHCWCAMALGGLVGDDRAVVLMQHHKIDCEEVWTVLERRWPETVLTEPGAIEPAWEMTAEHAATLARHRRGVEPLRIIVPAQRVSMQRNRDAPMPIVA